MYRLIAIDIDWTLLDNQHQVSERNKQAIKDVINAGKILSLATGRPLQGVTDFIDMIGADMPFIIYNGAMVITSISKKVLYESILAGELASEVVRFGLECGTNVFVYKNGELHVPEMNGMVKRYTSLFEIKPVVVDDMVRLAAQGVTKVLYRDTPELVAELQNAVHPHFKGKMNYFTSQPGLMEFVDLNTSKGAAMQKIGEYYNIPQSEMMAIGDNFNDVEMLRYAGLGVAMGNAPTGVKDAADVVTTTNEEDGVAEAIYRYVLCTT
jgi:Cof subfamily protein (haloacid dehalogenase superfamily)